MADARSRVTEILQAVDLADPTQAEELLELVYQELRAIAARELGREKPDHLLQPTALVHEAYIRLVEGPPVGWKSRAHFYGVAARAMRQVLVDEARRRESAKRGGGWRRVTLDPEAIDDQAQDVGLLDLHEALVRLGLLDGALERLVELRFFSGLTVDEAADALGISRRTAARDWNAARLWLRRELVGG